MYTSRNFVYYISGYRIVKLNIKYKMVEYIEFQPKLNIALFHKGNNIFSRGNTVCIILDDSPPLFLDLKHIMYIIQVDNYVVSRNYFKINHNRASCNIEIYNLETKIKKFIEGYPYFEIIRSPFRDRKILLKFLERQGHIVILICNNVEECMQVLTKTIDAKNFNSCNGVTWLSNDKLICLECYDFYISFITIFDLNLEPKIVIDLQNHKLPFHHNNFAVCNEIIYLWCNKIILVIQGLNVTEVCAQNNIQLYSQYHNVFIDSYWNLYRIYDCKLVKFHFEYDIWRDIDKPEQINTIITIYMYLDMLPNEIYNVVYQCLINLFIH